MSKSHQDSPVAAADAQRGDAYRALVKAMRAQGSSQDDIIKVLTVTPEQAKAIVEWVDE